MPKIILESVPGEGGHPPLLLLSSVERERRQLAIRNARARAADAGWTDAMECGEDDPIPAAFERILDALAMEGEIASDDLIRESCGDRIVRKVFVCREPTAGDKLAVLTARRRRLASESDAAEWSEVELRLLEAEICREILDPRLPEGEDAILSAREEESLRAQCHALVFPSITEERLFFTMRLRLDSAAASGSTTRTSPTTRGRGSG